MREPLREADRQKEDPAHVQVVGNGQDAVAVHHVQLEAVHMHGHAQTGQGRGGQS